MEAYDEPKHGYQGQSQFRDRGYQLGQFAEVHSRTPFHPPLPTVALAANLVVTYEYASTIR